MILTAAIDSFFDQESTAADLVEAMDELDTATRSDTGDIADSAYIARMMRAAYNALAEGHNAGYPDCTSDIVWQADAIAADYV